MFELIYRARPDVGGKGMRDREVNLDKWCKYAVTITYKPIRLSPQTLPSDQYSLRFTGHEEERKLFHSHIHCHIIDRLIASQEYAVQDKMLSWEEEEVVRSDTTKGVVPAPSLEPSVMKMY